MKNEWDRMAVTEKLEILFNYGLCSHLIVHSVEAECEACQKQAHVLDSNYRRDKRISILELAFMMVIKTSRPMI